MLDAEMLGEMPLGTRDEDTAGYRLAVILTSPKQPDNWLCKAERRACEACQHPYRSRLYSRADVGLCASCMGTPRNFRDKYKLLRRGYSREDLYNLMLAGGSLAMLDVMAG